MRVMTKREAIEFVRHRAPFFNDQDNPFARSEWLIHFLEHVADDDWKIWAAVSEQAGGAVMLLYSVGSAQPQALTNYYASLYSPIVTPFVSKAAPARELVGKLSARGSHVSTVQLAPLSTEDADAMSAALDDRGFYVKRYFCFGNWYLPCIDQSYDEYMARCDSKLRNTIARKSKKFFADPANRLEIITDPADVDRAVSAYSTVYLNSWKQPEPYPGFVPGWARICAQHGWLRLGVAWVDDVPVAAQFWFVIDGRAFIFKLAYDEAFAGLSAGTILTARMFKHALDVDQVDEIDYLTGDDGYKKGWMTHRRERVGLIACNTRSIRGLGRALFEAAGSLRGRLRLQQSGLWIGERAEGGT